MSDAGRCRITLDGNPVDVEQGITVAAVLANLGVTTRRSASGEPRAALCGMGICHECRVTVNGRPHQRSCMMVVAPGMVIERDV